jgi:hypothetical protein
MRSLAGVCLSKRPGLLLLAALYLLVGSYTGFPDFILRSSRPNGTSIPAIVFRLASGIRCIRGLPTGDEVSSFNRVAVAFRADVSAHCRSNEAQGTRRWSLPTRFSSAWIVEAGLCLRRANSCFFSSSNFATIRSAVSPAKRNGPRGPRQAAARRREPFARNAARRLRSLSSPPKAVRCFAGTAFNRSVGQRGEPRVRGELFPVSA